jgi:hypothetical protein
MLSCRWVISFIFSCFLIFSLAEKALAHHHMDMTRHRHCDSLTSEATEECSAAKECYDFCCLSQSLFFLSEGSLSLKPFFSFCEKKFAACTRLFLSLKMPVPLRPPIA